MSATEATGPSFPNPGPGGAIGGTPPCLDLDLTSPSHPHVVPEPRIFKVKRVLVVTWALGTATGVLLGLFGVELVSSRFSTAGVSPLSRPEVLRALQAARSVPPAADAVALPTTGPTAAPPST